MSAPVFLAEPGTLDGMRSGAEYLLDGTEGRHAGVVQRRGPGERVDVVDCTGVRLRGRVLRVTVDGVHLAVDEVRREQRTWPALVLAQALAKGDRDELAIEAATELGADTVVPWQAERSIVVWRGERAARSRARWLGTVRTATKQSRRSRVPDVEHAVDTAALATRVASLVGAGGVALVLHEAATVPLATAALPEPGRQAEVLVVVGPEGGVAPGELADLTGAGALPVRLGPLVLRTSTAGPAALALLNDRLARWS